MYINITKFLGQDSRRSELTSQPGTLLELTNAHVNQGGEIEGRKAFVRTARPDGTFGLQSTTSGLVTFGSDSTPTGFPNFNIGTVSVPFYVNYQRLQHPAVLAGETYDANKHDLTEVVCSESFGGYAFAVARFSDGKVYSYYNGVLVYDFTNGLVLEYMGTTVKYVTALVATINRTADFNATQVSMATVALVRASNVTTVTVASTANLTTGSKVTISGVTASAFNTTEASITVLNGTQFTYANTGADDTATVQGTVLAANFLIEGPSGLDYSLTSIEDSVSGSITTPAIKQAAVAYQPGTSAVSSFKIMAGSNGVTPTSATGTITRTATNAANTEYVIIGNKRYTFKTTLSTEGDVHIKASAALTLAALKDAINHTGIPGTDYLCNGAHPNVRAGTIAGNDLSLTAEAGSSGNSVALTANFSSSLWTVSGAAMTGGAGNCVAVVSVVSLTQVETRLTNAAVAYASTNALTAVAVAQEINNNTSSGLAHGYFAESEDNLVTIFSSLTASPMPNQYSLKIVAGGNVCIGDCMFYYVLRSLSFKINTMRAGGIDMVGGAYVYPTGGTYDTLSELYAQQEVDINSLSGESGIVAKASTDYMQVSRLVTRSDDVALPIYITFDNPDHGGVIFGVPSNQPGAFVATIPSTLTSAAPNAYHRGVGTSIQLTDGVTVEIVGGVAPYTYDWYGTGNGTSFGAGVNNGNGTQSNNYDDWGISFVTDGQPTMFFKIRGFTGAGLEFGTYTSQQAFACKVTDAQGREADTLPITINCIV